MSELDRQQALDEAWTVARREEQAASEQAERRERELAERVAQALARPRSSGN